MPCSDSMAMMLEETDPLFRQRNEHMQAVDNYIIRASEALCSYGEALYEGKAHCFKPKKPPAVSWSNHYIVEIEDCFKDFGGETHRSRIDKIEAANRGGAPFYRWLIEHWSRELSGLTARNERHIRELPRRSGEKAAKRREALSVDVPKAALREKQIEWAKREASLAELTPLAE